MLMSKINPGDKIQVDFETMALGGRAKGTAIGSRHGIYSIFSEFAAPGDRAIVQVINVRKRYVEGDLVQLLMPGPDRVEPVCPHFTICGSCNWQHFSYPRQLTEKASIVSYVLSRKGLGKDLFKECNPSATPLGYRFRADLTFIRMGDRFVGGYFRHRSHELENLDSCPLLVAPLSDRINDFKQALSAQYTNVPEQWPIRVRLIHDPESDECFAHVFKEGDVPDGFFRLNDKRLVSGEEVQLAYTVGGMKIRYSPECFTQVNLDTNEQLVAEAVRAMDLKPKDRVLELFSGIGNFSFLMAKNVRSVLAVEGSAIATSFSKINAGENGITNVDHMTMRCEKACLTLTRQGLRFSKVLVDPPREGIGEQTANLICSLEPERVVYVSCHPESLAEDLKTFALRGYEIESVTGFDMFGQTFHVETVTVLTRKS